jgi:signal transduction histidine kinase
MDWQKVIYLLPYLIPLLASIGISHYAWRRRDIIGAKPLAFACLVGAITSFFYMFELLSPSLQGKIFWDDLQFINMLYTPIFILAFALQYARFDLPHPNRVWGGLGLVASIFMALVFTDAWHGLARENTLLLPGEPFSEMVYDFTPLFLAMVIFAYALFLIAALVLITRVSYLQRFYRKRVYIVLIGLSIPFLGGLATIAGIQFTSQRDTTPFTLVLASVIIAWGLFRYRFFELIPVARDTVFENINDLVFVTDADRCLVDLNPAAYQAIKEYSPVAIGHTVDEVFSPWPGLVDRFHNVEDGQIEIDVDMPTGLRFFDVRLSTLHDRRGNINGSVIVAHDITGRRRAEEEIRQKTLRLEAANQELAETNARLEVLSQVKDQFIANVSHELRTPLSSFMLYLDLLALHPDKLEPFSNTLKREAARLESLIEGLLILSRLDQHRQEFHFASVDLNQLVRDYCADRSSLAESKGLSLRIVDSQPLPPLQGDANLLGQVLSILLTNAFNYTPSGGLVTVSAQAGEIEGRPAAGFSVNDTGPGISPEEQTQLFKRFFRGKAASISKVPGTGLGLAIVKEIIDRHHGWVELQSTGLPGEGATFRIWLPASDQNAQNAFPS